MHKIISKLLDLVYVPACPVCREPCREHICPDCKKLLDGLYSPMEIFRPTMHFDLAMSAFCFEDEAVKDLVYCLKRKGVENAVVTAGEYLCSLVRSNSRFFDCNYVCYLPRSKEAMLSYGFDQARLLAVYLSQRLGLELWDKLSRVGKSESQKTLDLAKRYQNVKGKFVCDEKVFGASVILVDDMITTGASINEGSAALLSAGFESVKVISLASADKR